MSQSVSNVIPFAFGAQQVRTMVIDDQPWFVAVDVSAALEYSEASAMTRHLDDDEKGLSIVQTLGGEQELLVINESGLYSAILRSRKAEAKRFKKWVTSEVLPAIRKQGRYEDEHGKMQALMAELSLDQAKIIKGLIHDKSKAVPTVLRQSFQLTMHNRLHTRFNVPRTELIPAGEFDAACNFIGGYALEGEFLGREEPKPRGLNIHFPAEALAKRRPGMLTDGGPYKSWLDVALDDLRDIRGEGTPCQEILWELERNGYQVEGALCELKVYRDKLRDFRAWVSGLNIKLAEPLRYAVDMGDAA